MVLAFVMMPYSAELTMVIRPVGFTWLSVLVESTRNSRRRCSLLRLTLRASEKFVTNIPGPSMVSRPAFPKVPAAGMEKAAGLKYPEPESIGWPVALARKVASDAVPSRLPLMVADWGRPVSAVRLPERVQSLRALLSQTGCERKP